MLKFGQLVNIDALDKISSEVSADQSADYDDKIAKVVEENDAEIMKLNIEHQCSKNELKDLTVESTSKLNQIALLSERQM
jgi:hypothetical protein